MHVVLTLVPAVNDWPSLLLKKCSDSSQIPYTSRAWCQPAGSGTGVCRVLETGRWYLPSQQAAVVFTANNWIHPVSHMILSVLYC